jgi:HPt (histidine-containing phosphotransfer) domain-containing protein
MTAHAMSGDEQKSLDAGMNDHVTKPIDPDQFFITLQKWIKPASERDTVQKSLIPDLTSEPGQVDPADDDLPEFLPGFDLAAGLLRLRGNRRLYRKLLLDFAVSYSGVADEIRVALKAKDVRQTHSLVHNLKGLAGNLEAINLQAAAAEMEKLIKGDQKDGSTNDQMDQIFMELEKAINQALESVQTLGLPVEEKLIESSADWSPDVPVEQRRLIADRIRSAADMGDVIQIQSIAEGLKAEFDNAAPFCDELIRLAEDFDFDGIQKIVLALDS